jgi:SAM-dependent methyltransferase
VKGWDISTYGDRIADVYDEEFAELDPTEAVDVLAELARGGPVLELAVGTGRIAVPLAARGIDVHGIDASEAMVAKLREKEGGDRIPVTMGDFADVGVDGRYPLVFVAFNTFFGLVTQDDQVRCFENVAAHLTDDGVFVLEAFVPDVARFDRGQRVSAGKIELDSVRLGVDRHDPVSQTLESQQVTLSPSGIRFQPIHLRYAWPAELDLMARLAGLRLHERWGGWDRAKFTAASTRHVSVYGR